MAEVILALDVPTADDGRRLLDRLPALRWVKLGSVLVTREGAPFVRECVARGLRVFLDLKWHDIPNTVAGAVQAAAADGVALATVHASGGAAMCAAAVGAAAGRLALVGVTVLTSHDSASYAEATGRPAVELAVEVERLARLAVGAGLTGVVCSPLEASRLRSAVGPDAWLVVPGIRGAGDPVGDQRRTADAATAVRAGATHLVVGRPITLAADPGGALARIVEVAGA